MKRFITVFSIFLFFSLCTNITNAYAEPESKSFTQGMYKFTDTGLAPGIAYKIRNSSPTGKTVVIVFDSNQMMQEFIRLEANSTDYLLKPLDFGSIIIVIGAGSIIFS